MTQSRASTLFLGFLAFSLTSCGFAAPGTLYTSSGSGATGAVLGWNQVNGGATQGSGGGYASTHPIGGGGSGTAPYAFKVQAVGYTSTTFTVTANQVLKIRFAPGVQNQVVSGTSQMANYSGLGVYITVGNKSQPTPLLHNGFNGTRVESSNAFDFSSQINSGCAASDSTCRGNVTITVSQPNYDFFCLYYGTGCPWAHVYSNHPWNGTLTVQTDDTNAI